ncbi:MAG: Ppx/GppA phosphatase family protein [Archangium sp.]|nr:Ppx/GppA phosphatase family protein [Archangium sp.]
MARRTRPEVQDDILGAIDVGTNAVRLELARVLPDGSIEGLHTERDPVRPGEGLFRSGVISREVADRLVATLRRYSALCKRYGARVRAVATSALREARNREEIVRRVKREAQLSLDVVSGREEARLICLGVLHGKQPHQRSLCIDIGGGSTEIIFANGDQPKDLWSLDLGAVRLTELFEVKDTLTPKKLELMRNFAREMLNERIKGTIKGLPSSAIGSSGTIGAIVTFARSEGYGHATMQEVSQAVEQLAEMDSEKRRKRFDPRRADIVVAGAVVLEAVMRRFKVHTLTAVDRGLREGILYDLLKRRKVDVNDRSLTDGALALGRRFAFSEEHGVQVSRLALTLFDELATLHQLPAAARPYLEVAAMLHDLGHAVNYQKHHKHTHYLIVSSDLPGLTERERLLVALIARFHRRSKPEPTHELLAPLTPAEFRLVRKCATLLRVADSLDRSHHQPVKSLSAQVRGRTVALTVKARDSVDLELWDLQHEVELFREVFGKSLQVTLSGRK